MFLSISFFKLRCYHLRVHFEHQSCCDTFKPNLIVHFFLFPLSLKLRKNELCCPKKFRKSDWLLNKEWYPCNVSLIQASWRILGNSGAQYSRYAGTTSHSSCVWYQSLVRTYYTHIHKWEYRNSVTDTNAHNIINIPRPTI